MRGIVLKSVFYLIIVEVVAAAFSHWLEDPVFRVGCDVL